MADYVADGNYFEITYSAKQQEERDLQLRKDIKSLKIQNLILAFCLAAMIAMEFLIKFVR